MRPEERQAIRERVNKAMPGPWEWSQERMGVLLGGHDELGWLKVLTVLAFDIDPDDAAFIAHAREDVPKLLDENERLRNAIQQVIPRLNDMGLFNTVDVLQKALDGDDA